jgi:16S rRNA pseudouridine516 synthase
MSAAKAPTMRLDRLLTNLGYGSRREVQIMAKHGRLKQNGEPLRVIDHRVPLTPEFANSLTFDGEPLDPLPGVVLMLHKPLGVTCSHKDLGTLVYTLLPERWRRREPAISTIGRLDKETSGLLLMTDDGAFLHKIISPKRRLPKRYLAKLDRPLRGDEADVFAAGTLMLEGEEKPLLPAVLEVLSSHEVALTLTEGRYHQVRRMFAAVGNHVTALHRESVGALTMPDDLREGDFVVLGEAQKAALLKTSPIV